MHLLALDRSRSRLPALEQPKELPAPLLRLDLLPDLPLHLLFGDVPPERIPRHRAHANHRGQHAPEHRADALRVPAVVLRERPEREPAEVRRRRVARGVP